MAVDPTQEVLVYLDEVLAILHWSRSKFYSVNSETGMRWCDELRRSGVIHYQYEGRPPKKRIKGFPSSVRNWMRVKSSRGQRI